MRTSEQVLSTVSPTQAARELESNLDASPHKLISLLMSGTLERISQARQSIIENNTSDKDILLDKILALVTALRESLNFKQGGDVAVNLNDLYIYMVEILNEAHSPLEELSALEEISQLMEKIKSGWDEIEMVEEVA